MKKFSSIDKSINECYTGPVMSQGVTNHYTPIENIVIMVKNLFACRLSIVAEVAEDNVSLKLSSSRFTSEDNVYRLLNEPFFNENQTIASYVMTNGLDKMTMVNLGNEIVVYYSPSDVVGCEVPNSCKMHECEISNFKSNAIMESGDDDVELKDPKIDKIKKIITSKDKIKAAKDLSDLVSKEITLPDSYYWKAVVDTDKNVSIALRYKMEKRRPHGKTASIVRSIINIFGDGPEAIWIGDFDQDSLCKPTPDMKQFIDNIINFLGATPTSDPCVYAIGDKETKPKEEKKEDSKSKDDESKPKDDEQKPKVDDSNETEDDPAREENDD